MCKLGSTYYLVQLTTMQNTFQKTKHLKWMNELNVCQILSGQWPILIVEHCSISLNKLHITTS